MDGRRSLVGCSPWGHEESDTTEWLHFHFSLSCIGEGNGNPLQCSCLENPRDGGAWWAAIYGVTQSQTRLKRLSSSSSMDHLTSKFVDQFISKAYQKVYNWSTSLVALISSSSFLQVLNWKFCLNSYSSSWSLPDYPHQTLIQPGCHDSPLNLLPYPEG